MKCIFLILFCNAFVPSAFANSHAAMSVVITKKTFTPENGGTFLSEEVCQAKAPIEVIDDKKGEEQTEHFYKIKCDSKNLGEDVEVYVGGLVHLNDLRWTMLGLWVDPDSAAHKLLTVNTNFATELGNKRSAAVLEPFVDMDCAPQEDGLHCWPTVLKEYFSVQVQVEALE